MGVRVPLISRIKIIVVMEKKFDELLVILNNPQKEAHLRALWNTSNNVGRLGLLSALKEFLGIKEESLNDTVERLLIPKK
jgi:hypothetical protein